VIQAELKDGKLHIVIPTNDLNNLPLSSTGKTLIVASSGGSVETSVKVNDKPVKLTLSAFVKP